MKKPHLYKVKSGEKRARGTATLKRNMLDQLQAQLDAADAIDPTGYLEARRMVYIRAMEDLIDRADQEGNLYLMRTLLVDLAKFSSLNKSRVEMTVRPAGLQPSPKLAQLSETELMRIAQAPDNDPVFALEDKAKEPHEPTPRNVR